MSGSEPLPWNVFHLPVCRPAYHFEVSINDGSLDLKKGGVYTFYSLFARSVPNQAPSQSTSLIM